MSFGKFSTVILVRARPYFQESLILVRYELRDSLPRLLHLKVHFMMQKIFRQNLHFNDKNTLWIFAPKSETFRNANIFGGVFSKLSMYPENTCVQAFCTENEGINTFVLCHWWSNTSTWKLEKTTCVTTNKSRVLFHWWSNKSTCKTCYGFFFVS